MQETTLPVLVLNNIILFPYSEMRLEFEKDKEREILSLAESYYNKHVLLVYNDNNNINDLSKIGIIGYINMKIDIPNDKVRVVIKGLNRVNILEYQDLDGITTAKVEKVVYKELDRIEEIAYSRGLVKQLEFYIDHNSNVSNSILSSVSNITDLDKLTDLIVDFLAFDDDKKIKYLYEIDPTIRAMMLIKNMKEELRIIKLEEKIDEEVEKSMDNSQREYILQEKLKVIKNELGIKFDKDEEINSIYSKINNLKAPRSIKNRLFNELKRYETLSDSSLELGNIKNYIDIMLSLPWGIYTKDNKDLKKAKEILDASHFALKNVKDHILDYLALLQIGRGINTPILCFVGPPGVGKTTLAKSIAKAMDRNYVKISVGGISDEGEIIGHRRTYLSSSYGKIVGGIRKAGSLNPVFVIDEIDKMTKDIKGDPASCLLEVLDKEQNKTFVDNYLDEEFDLSKVLFICTANYEENIPLELYDRMEIIHLSSYTIYEKLNICKNYIIPNLKKEYNLNRYNIIFQDEALMSIIENYTNEAGVRELERVILSIFMKIAKDILMNKVKYNKVIVDKKSLFYYLGPSIYVRKMYQNQNLVGVVNALGYTLTGGDVLKIEVTSFNGNGNIKMTGSLGEVFIESVNIALSYVKNNCKDFNIPFDLLNNSDIHLHVPSATIKKDGSSAGIAITTAIISLFTKKEVSIEYGMTGEMTLSGTILPVSGIKEKIIGAKKNNIKTVFIPVDNKKDLDILDDDIKEGINFILVTDYKDVFKYIFSLSE